MTEREEREVNRHLVEVAKNVTGMADNDVHIGA
jgi:hypothetical protein